MNGASEVVFTHSGPQALEQGVLTAPWKGVILGALDCDTNPCPALARFLFAWTDNLHSQLPNFEDLRLGSLLHRTRVMGIQSKVQVLSIITNPILLHYSHFSVCVWGTVLSVPPELKQQEGRDSRDPVPSSPQTLYF